MVALVTYAAAAVAFSSWMFARLRPVPVVLVACSDGTIREVAANDPRITGRI
jgi:hypothetical protein